MRLCLRTDLYVGVPVYFWPWVFWQLLQLDLWVEQTGRSVLGAVCKRTGEVFITFTADETDEVSTELVLHVQAADDASGFNARDGNISARPLSNASVVWTPVPWTTEGDEHETPDLSALIQEGHFERAGGSP